jgi:hypothetical protein
MQGGVRAELDLSALMAKRGSVSATTLRARPVAEKSAIVAAVTRHVWPWVAAGEVRPVVDRVVPLPDAAEAHRVVEAGEHVGKVLLRAPGHRGSVPRRPRPAGPTGAAPGGGSRRGVCPDQLSSARASSRRSTSCVVL